MYRLIVVAALLGLLAAIPGASVAEAAPCAIGATRQDDMAGEYASSLLYVAVYPCGGVYVEWWNEGRRFAAYGGEARIRSGGIVAYHIPEGGRARLDSVDAIFVKPAEYGYIELWTIDSATTNVQNTYRLRKIS